MKIDVELGPTWVRSGGEVTSCWSIPRHGTPGLAGAGTAAATGLPVPADKNNPTVTTAPIADRFVVRDMFPHLSLCRGLGRTYRFAELAQASNAAFIEPLQMRGAPVTRPSPSDIRINWDNGCGIEPNCR